MWPTCERNQGVKFPPKNCSGSQSRGLPRETSFGSLWIEHHQHVSLSKPGTELPEGDP